MKAILALFVTLAIVLLPVVCAAESTVWLETEHFDQLGGWTNDAQYVDQMGSPYLLAVGLDGPVADAAARCQIPAAGEYRLWVRCRDWLVEHSPGRFQIVLGGKTLPHVFGQAKAKDWVWEDGGVHRLGGGPLEVRLHDLTGHYGRCDCVVLTADLSYRPPSDIQELAAARQQHGGVSREPKHLELYDTVVVGGGLAGTVAAVASARMGCRTALVQNRPVLGGNASTEVLVHPQGDTTGERLDPGEGGIVEEFRSKTTEDFSPRMLQIVRAEKSLDLYLNTHATGVRMKSAGRVAAVEALDVTTGRRLVFPGSIFIDCTGDGSIGVWAGAEHRHGREPRSVYDESRAPEQGDSHTMGGTLRYATAPEAKPVPFRAPPWARKFPKCSDFNPSRHPRLRFGGWQWVIEYGGMFDTCADAEEIRDELLRIIWGMWDHAKNHCPRLKGEAANYRLVWVSHVVGKRESRRLVGDYVMTEHDVANMTLFPDRVAYGGWGIDLHPPAGFYDKGPPATFSHKTKFSIPFRSLYTKNVNNLMMAGRCISVSHAALGATRVMITCGVQGQAVGTAAGLCKRHACPPREIHQKCITDLQQQLLADGCYIIDLPNRDPHDLARGAEITASSVAPPSDLPQQGLSDLHPLGCDRAVMFRVTQQRIDKISLYLHSEKTTPTDVRLGLRPASQLGDFSSRRDLAATSATVPSRSEGWVEFELGAKVKPGYYYVWLPSTPGLSWSLFGSRPPGTIRAYRSAGGWQVVSACYTYKLDPPPDVEMPPGKRPAEIFAAANVTNGFARAIRGWPNSWRPDPKKPLPHWIQLDFGGPVTLNCVHISFQTKALRADAFRIEAADGDTWRTLAQVADNTHRRRLIDVDRTTTPKLRLVLSKAQPGAGVCEIRVYGGGN